MEKSAKSRVTSGVRIGETERVRRSEWLAFRVSRFRECDEVKVEVKLGAVTSAW